MAFEKITGENIKKRLAIVLDGEVYAAPVIQDRIAGGEASISGDFTTDEANDLAVVLRAGSLSLNTVTHACSVGSESVTLSKREYALLAALMTRPGAILSRRALEEKLYAPGDEPESNAVEYLIHSLRKKIGASAIENIRGLGWRVPADKNAAQ